MGGGNCGPCATAGRLPTSLGAFCAAIGEGRRGSSNSASASQLWSKGITHSKQARPSGWTHILHVNYQSSCDGGREGATFEMTLRKGALYGQTTTKEVKADRHGFRLSRLSQLVWDARNAEKAWEIPYDAGLVMQGYSSKLLGRRESHVSTMEQLNSDLLTASLNLKAEAAHARASAFLHHRGCLQTAGLYPEEGPELGSNNYRMCQRPFHSYLSL